MKAKCPKTGEEVEAKFTRLAVDPCIYRYEDALGRVILLLEHVDEIVVATNNRAFEGNLLASHPKKWANTTQGQMNRFLGI